MQKIYLAGPDVFRPDANEYGKKLSALVTSYGFEPLFPIEGNDKPIEALSSKAIYDANVAKIIEADIILANVNEFRGHEPDSGTVWEIGYGAALGKKIICYLDNGAPIAEKITGTKDNFLDAEGMIIEDFDLPLNLMLVHGADKIVIGGAEEALKFLRENG